ncbi:MAG: hypothetical protein ACREXN_02060 [Polaromonas sp.]
MINFLAMRVFAFEGAGLEVGAWRAACLVLGAGAVQRSIFMSKQPAAGTGHALEAIKTVANY